MGFIAPWFLAGLVAVALPVWLHLLKQHKSTPLPFSSLMFFERRTQSSIKHRRLRYLVLFALRTALIALLVFAFARPFLPSATVASAGGGKLLVIAIDNSFSMRQGDRLSRAKADALRTAASLRPEDRGQVLAFGQQVHLMGEPAAGVEQLRAGVEAIQSSDDRGSYAELARTLRSIAKASRMPVELHLFSDMQKSSLPSSFADLRLGDGIRLVPHPVVTGRLPNFAVESVMAPRHLYDPKKVRIQATLAGHGTARATVRVSLVLNGREMGSKTVDIAPGGRASVEFLSLDAPYGMNRGEIRIDSHDAFPADDHFNFSIERSDPRPALFVHEGRNERGLLYFRTALDASTDAAFKLESVAADQAANLAPSKFAFVVLSDVGSIPASFEQALRSYVRAGGSVWIALGRASAIQNQVPLFDQQIRDARYATPEGDRFQTVASLDSAHPAIGKANRWDDLKFYQSIKVDPGKSTVIARLTDDTPLLMDKKIGEGRVMVFASTFDNISNDFPLHASFVPFIEQTSHYLGGLDAAQANYAVGSYLELRSARGQGAAAEVLDPSGHRALSLSEAARAQNIQLQQEGFYDVRRPNGRDELVAVNPDRHESDLEVIPAETLSLWQNTGQGGRGAPGSAESGKKPFDFWWYIMILAFIVAVAESLLGNRHLSVDKEAA